MKPFLVVLVLFGLHLVSARTTCKQFFNDAYKDKKDSFWKYDKQYDYFGNKVDKPKKVHLCMTRNMDELEGKINEQINKELYAHYTYLSIAAHFGRDDIFLLGFQKFFKKAAAEEAEHAQMLMELLNKRGGQIKLQGIPAPFRQQWGSGLMAMEDALCLEKQILDSLLKVHKAAEIPPKDVQIMDFIEGNFLNEQIESIKILSTYVNTLKRVGEGLGEYEFDKTTLGGK